MQAVLLLPWRKADAVNRRTAMVYGHFTVRNFPVVSIRSIWWAPVPPEEREDQGLTSPGEYLVSNSWQGGWKSNM